MTSITSQFWGAVPSGLRSAAGNYTYFSNAVNHFLSPFGSWFIIPTRATLAFIPVPRLKSFYISALKRIWPFGSLSKEWIPMICWARVTLLSSAMNSFGKEVNPIKWRWRFLVESSEEDISCLNLNFFSTNSRLGMKEIADLFI